MAVSEISELEVDPNRPFLLGDWIVEPDQLRLRQDDDIRQLEAKTMDLLLLFVANYGRTLSKDEIFDGLWGDRFVEDSAIKHLVWQLRKDLGDAASEPRYIQTIRRRGYRLVAAPRPLRREESVIAAVSPGVASSATGWVHQLPPPPADFTGRQEELMELREAVNGGGATLLGLVGMGGVGKTALALRLADELTNYYPDAQIYLDLKGVSREPMTVAQAMAHVIRSFRPNASLPDEDTALASLYRSVLHGQRAILLMDNAAGPDQIEPLLPPCGCALLTTSRSSFALPGLAVQYLNALALEDSVTLLQRIAPRMRDEAETIAELCGCLPLALRLAGSTIAERRDLRPEEYARRLVEGRERLELVEASLAVSLELIRPELHRLWQALAVFPGTFDAAAAAAVWDQEPERAQRNLGALVQRSLVEWSDGRYGLHDLARLFAGSHLPSDERLRVKQRHAEHYLGVLKRANKLYLEGGDSATRGLRILDSEWSSIKAGQAWASFYKGKDTVRIRLWSEYAMAGRHCLSLRLPPLCLVDWLDSGLKAAQDLDDGHTQAELLGQMGSVYLHHQPRRALELHEEALVIGRRIDNPSTICFNLFGLANTNFCLGNLRHSLELHEEAIALARRIGNRRLEGRCLGGAATVYESLGEPHVAGDLLKQSLRIARETGDRFFECNAICGLGWVRLSIGEPQRAVELMERALLLAKDLGDSGMEAESLLTMSRAYTDLGKPRRSLEFSKKGLDRAREMDQRLTEIRALEGLGHAYKVLKQPCRVLEVVDDALVIAHKVGYQILVADLLILQAWAHAATGKQNSAKDALKRALAIARETECRRLAAESSWDLGLIYAAEEQLPRAVKLMQVRVAYDQAIGHPDAKARVVQVEELRNRMRAGAITTSKSARCCTPEI